MRLGGREDQPPAAVLRRAYHEAVSAPPPSSVQYTNAPSTATLRGRFAVVLSGTAGGEIARPHHPALVGLAQ